jgi:hypothetical protein
VEEFAMRIRPFFLGFLLLLFVGHNPPRVQSVGAVRVYNGTSSVGDFFTFTVDPVAYTLTYTDWSNGDEATTSYRVDSDGTYQLVDPNRNLVLGYEVPNHGLLIQATNTGPDHETAALVVAVQNASLSLPQWAGRKYNFLQLGIGTEGFQVGSLASDDEGNVNTTAYWPLGSLSPGHRVIQRGGFSGHSLQEDGGGTFLRLSDNDGGYHYLFGSGNEILAMDTPSGAIFAFKKAASKDFDPSLSGVYKGLYYQAAVKKESSSSEMGAPSLGVATVIVGADGEVSMKDGEDNLLLQGDLTPFADASYLYGGNTLQDRCFGLFTSRASSAESQTDIFVGFMDRGVLVSSLNTRLPWGGGIRYEYLYGVGLR